MCDNPPDLFDSDVKRSIKEKIQACTIACISDWDRVRELKKKCAV